MRGSYVSKMKLSEKEFSIELGHRGWKVQCIKYQAIASDTFCFPFPRILPVVLSQPHNVTDHPNPVSVEPYWEVGQIHYSIRGGAKMGGLTGQEFLEVLSLPGDGLSMIILKMCAKE